MSRYQLIVFDWDGTLMDSTAHIVSCMQQAIKQQELPALTDTAIRQIIGLGLFEAVHTLYPDLDKARLHALEDCYRQIWLADPVEMPLFANARELISELASQDCFLSVATGKSRRGLDKVLKSTGLGDFFHATRCADECHSKPHPQMIEELMDYTGVNAHDTLMIGDTEFDLMMAHNAKAHSLGITHGAHSEKRLQQCQPQAIVHDLHQVQQWLTNQHTDF